VLQNKKRIVVVGGGITGLTTAYYLQKEAEATQLEVEVILIEASHRLGGKIHTLVQDGFVIERGPDSFLARKTSAAKLAEEVGMSKQLIRNATGKAYVLVNGKLHPMPGGSIMGIPTRMAPFITTGLFTIPGKIRASADFILPRSNIEGDQSLGKFFRRRLGDEVVENLIEPLLSGIYAGDIDQLSLLSTFPQFHQVEQKHRSLIIGMKKTNTPPADQKEKELGKFLTFSTGLQSFVDAIEKKLNAQLVLKGVKVENVLRKSDETYQLSLNDGTRINADSIVVTTPHYTFPSMFSSVHFFDELKQVPSTSVATVAMAFTKESIQTDIDGTGFVVSRNGDYSITACTWTHRKWPHTTPEGSVLLRCYVGRAGDEAIVDLSDSEIEAIVLDDLKNIMNITSKPQFTVVSRWKNAMPQYTVGHKARIQRMFHNLKTELPGVFVAGSSIDGLGLPDCIRQGESVVKDVLEYLNLSNKV
jgi:oxygen-dependent protoporphyrinogen oxidase